MTNKLDPALEASLQLKQPRFCIIAPTPYLERYATQSTAHLVLAHIVKEDPSYAAFYKRLSARGDFIIMDNGAFELGKSYDPDQLVELGKACGAQTLVLPDYPFEDASITVDAAKKYIPLFLDEGFKTMFVPQGVKGDLEQWVASYKWAAANPDIHVIGMSILGIPAALPHIPAAYARVVMTQILKERGLFNHKKHHHYLGLNAGPGLEVPALRAMNALDTLDSSAPVWQGLLGVEYNRNCDSYAPVKKIHFPVQFDYAMTKDRDSLRRIQHNIDLTLELFGQRNDVRRAFYVDIDADDVKARDALVSAMRDAPQFVGDSPESRAYLDVIQRGAK